MLPAVENDCVSLFETNIILSIWSQGPAGSMRYYIISIQGGKDMPLIKWRDSYSVGVERFDEEHKQLVELINEMFEMVRDKKSVNHLQDAIAKLIEYTRIHFADEEEAMEEVEYPHLEEHREIHANLLRQVLEFQEELRSGREELKMDLYKFLREWLMNHILDEDMKYSTYLSQEKESVAQSA
jgi:hemerythrin-like metal-binding protein